VCWQIVVAKRADGDQIKAPNQSVAAWCEWSSLAIFALMRLPPGALAWASLAADFRVWRGFGPMSCNYMHPHP
jgi:hypothetical protein